MTYSATEVLTLFTEDEMQFLGDVFPHLDIEFEAVQWADWWNGAKRSETPPTRLKVSFRNWLKNEEKYRLRDEAREGVKTAGNGSFNSQRGGVAPDAKDISHYERYAQVSPAMQKALDEQEAKE